MYTASIEIAASPEHVREKFLDFSQLKNYHQNGFFKSISTVPPNAPLEVGTDMVNVLEIMTVKPKITENSPACFRWGGGIPGVVVGQHSFFFTPSKVTPGGTTFTQEENLTGMLAFLMTDNPIGRVLGVPKKTKNGWEKYNQDLKAWCEK